MDLSFPTRRSPKTFSFWPCNKSFIEQACSVKMAGYVVTDPDLRMGGGGGGGEGSHPDFEIRGGSLQKQIFRPFGPHFALSIRGGERGGLPGPFLGSAADISLVLFAFL